MSFNLFKTDKQLEKLQAKNDKYYSVWADIEAENLARQVHEAARKDALNYELRTGAPKHTYSSVAVPAETRIKSLPDTLETVHYIEVENGAASWQQKEVYKPLYRVRVYEDMTTVQPIQQFQNMAPAPGGGGAVGRRISGWSRKSRKAGIEKACKIRGLDKGFFVTLTYPDKYPTYYKVWARDLQVIRQRFLRAFPGAGGMWVKEFKIRKTGEFNAGRSAPHFHFLITGVEHMTDFNLKVWFYRNWNEIKSSPDDCSWSGVEVKKIEQRSGVARYVTKYMSKDENELPTTHSLKLQFPDWVISVLSAKSLLFWWLMVESPAPIGRIWAVFGTVDTAPYAEYVLDDKEASQFRRVAVQHMKANSKKKFAYIKEAWAKSRLNPDNPRPEPFFKPPRYIKWVLKQEQIKFTAFSLGARSQPTSTDDCTAVRLLRSISLSFHSGSAAELRNASKLSYNFKYPRLPLPG